MRVEGFGMVEKLVHYGAWRACSSTGQQTLSRHKLSYTKKFKLT
jgi:hypothetical protein